MNADTASRPVIVGVDGSEYSSAALRCAGTLAARLDARLEVITCIGMPDYLVVAHLEGGEHPLTARLEETARQAVEDALGRAFSGSRPAAVDVTVKFGAPGKVLVEESKRAQLLVVGRHGEGGFLGTSMGSVSKACAARSACPVVLVGQEPDTV
ncbi:Nucleotide-binding universal stress protein, UspA family [Pseudarthrobacter enclensis]|uniref:Universal stress protein UspA n=1 Tax=Pseudarthrobacter enclensis TaxID=993070 RepID=A0A0V8IT22_9MICC|nr:universal stress protein [Pseudarthrobacter enclensis]KSU77892.1 universal stress protein UspA [Pseudarthrobacter enclensis]SCB95913.1 Nucleotide-binding universal stress protein, UspA family [Pseudarthrobacter enclensis]